MARSMDDIYLEMRQEYSKISGLTLNDGGDMDLRMRALAYQLFTLESQSDWLSRQCFPQTASGVYLDYHAETRGLERARAECACGTIRFSIKTALTTALNIPSGVTCLSASGAEFITSSDGSIAPGSLYCDVSAMARIPGKSGNVPAGSIVFMVQPPTGVTDCYNPQSFTGGTDPEDDESLRSKILKSYNRLPNGANAAFYEALALSVPGVSGVSVIPRARGRGTVDVVITSHGGTPTTTLLQEISDLVNSMREICVDIQVLSPDPVSVNLQISIEPADGFTQKQAENDVKSALEAYFDGSLLGKDILKVQLAKVILGISSVKNFSVNAPSSDMKINKTQLPVLETITFSSM